MLIKKVDEGKFSASSFVRRGGQVGRTIDAGQICIWSPFQPPSKYFCVDFSAYIGAKIEDQVYRFVALHFSW